MEGSRVQSPSKLPANGDAKQQQIRDLQLQVLRLETKLKDLHATDTVANKRALETLRQHAEALQAETQGISECIAALDVEPFSRDVIEEEMGAISATALATYIGDRLIKASKMLDSKEVRGAVWTLSATYVVWRLTFRFWQKFKVKVQRNKRSKSQLDESYSKVQERIDIMGQLVPGSAEA